MYTDKGEVANNIFPKIALKHIKYIKQIRLFRFQSTMVHRQLS